MASARSEEGLDSLAEEIRGGGGEAVAIPAAQALILNQRLSPAHARAVLTTRAGFALQKLTSRGPRTTRTTMYAPIRGHDTAKNGFRALSRSLYNWLEMQPGGEARGCGWHGAGTVGRPAKEVVKSASGSPESESNTRVTLTPP